MGKDFRRATKTNLVQVVSELDKQDTAYETKRSDKECIKRFYKWLSNSEDHYPTEAKWIKATRKNRHKILPERLLTEDEVNNEEHKLRIKKRLCYQESNSHTSSFCSRCGSPLDMKTAMQLHEEESKIDSLMDNLLEDTEVRELLLPRLNSMAT